MKLRVIALLSAVSLGALSLATAPASAKGGKAHKAKAAHHHLGKAGELPKKIRLSPKGLEWGMSVARISDLYKRVFDREFLPLYKKAEPGVETKALDAELADRKSLILRNKIEFGQLPTGIDSTPLKGEYSYRNGESMTRITLRSGTTRNFFFFDNKLWKVYDEHPLKKGGKLGDNFKDAVAYLTKRLGAPPKYVEPDYKKVMFKEAQWQNNDMLIRAVDRGGAMLGLVYVERSVQDSLSKYRKVKPVDDSGVDSDVKSILRKNEAPPAPSKGGKKKKR